MSERRLISIMGKGELVVPVIPILIVVLIISGVGFWFLTNSGSTPEHIQTIKSTSSYQELDHGGNPTVKTYEIDQSVVEFSKNHDFPYNLSKQAVSSPNPTFTIAVDFGGFSETESRLVSANTSERDYIYQLNSENDILNIVSSSRMISNLTQKQMEIRQKEKEVAKQKMCQNVSIVFTARAWEDKGYEFSLPKIQTANLGQNDYNEMIELKLDMEEGENITHLQYGLGAGGIYNFDVNQVSSFENVEKAILLPEECPGQKKVVTDFSSD